MTARISRGPGRAIFSLLFERIVGRSRYAGKQASP